MIAKANKYWVYREISHGLLFDLNSSSSPSDGRSEDLWSRDTHAWSFMLTQMQNPNGPTSSSIPATNPETGAGGELVCNGVSDTGVKTIAIHRHSESLRYLLRHLTASWTSKDQSPAKAHCDSADKQEL